MNWYEQLHYIGPAFALLLGAGVVMTADLIAPRRAPVLALTILVLLAAGLWAIVQAVSGIEGPALSGAIVVDRFALFFTFLLIGVSLAVVIATSEGLSRVEHRPEFFALLLTATGAMVLLAQSNDLIAIFVALETTSIAQFVLAGIARDDRSSEAGIKYLLSGAVAAAVLLYGFAFLFGLSGTTSLEGHRGLRPDRVGRDTTGARARLRAGRGGARLQDVDRAVPGVGTGRLRGRPDDRHHVPLGRLEGGGVRGGAAHLLRRPRRWRHLHRRALGGADRGARGRLDDLRQRRRDPADEREAAAGLLLDRAGGQHRGRARRRGRRERRRALGGAVLPRGLRGDERGRVPLRDRRLRAHRRGGI